MRMKSAIYAACLGLGMTITGFSGAYAGCLPGAVIDGTTANDARAKIEAAGYGDVTNLRKGCDNYWHGTATKDGQTVFVVVSKDTEVMEEGD